MKQDNIPVGQDNKLYRNDHPVIQVLSLELPSLLEQASLIGVLICLKASQTCSELKRISIAKDEAMIQSYRRKGDFQSDGHSPCLLQDILNGQYI